MDGEFVPSRSVGPEPLKSNPAGLEMEIHLMVRRPFEYIRKYNLPGIRRIIVHYESSGEPVKHIDEIHASGLSAGLAINPGTPVESVIHLLPYLESILVMTVNPGFYGSPFLPEMLSKVRELNGLRGDFQISAVPLPLLNLVLVSKTDRV